MRSFKSNENIHKKEGGSYYVVSANKASSVTLQSPGNESQRKHTTKLAKRQFELKLNSLLTVFYMPLIVFTRPKKKTLLNLFKSNSHCLAASVCTKLYRTIYALVETLTLRRGWRSVVLCGARDWSTLRSNLAAVGF